MAYFLKLVSHNCFKLYVGYGRPAIVLTRQLNKIMLLTKCYQVDNLQVLPNFLTSPYLYQCSDYHNPLVAVWDLGGHTSTAETRQFIHTVEIPQ